MTGAVTAALEARVILRLAAPDGAIHDVPFVIDTGFNGHLTAPPHFVEQLALATCGHVEAELADGRRVGFPVFEARLDWFGSWRDVPILASDGGYLLGMSVLRGCRVRFLVEPEGEIEIKRGRTA